jgi:hypothetical protein
MAKNKKNKQTDFSKHKIEETQRRNEYFKRLKVLCEMIHPDLYTMLAPWQRIIYEVRGLPFKIVADGKVSKDIIENINEYARMLQKSEVIPLGEHKISLTDYNRYLSPLEWMIHSDIWEPDTGPDMSQFAGIPWYEEFFKSREHRFGLYYDQVTNLLMMVSCFVSDIRYNLYYAYFEEKVGNSKNRFDIRQHTSIHIQARRSERRHIKLRNGEMRNALLVTIPMSSTASMEAVPEDTRFFGLALPPSQMGVEGLGMNKIRPVFISEHALNRLDERTGCASSGYMQMFLCQSVLKGTAQKTNDGRMLLDFEAIGHKIGYLVLSIQRDSVLIHTFLLLTANSTPEGKKLRAQLGLQKADHQYLGIDKLSTFVNSDILQHEDVCEWFRNAGCESLLKVCEILKGDELWQQDGEQILLAERMKNYLKTESTDTWDFADETDADADETDTEDEYDDERQIS